MVPSASTLPWCNVITSYSIHYTKLYDKAGLDLQRHVAVAQVIAGARQQQGIVAAHSADLFWRRHHLHSQGTGVIGEP